MRVRPEAKDLLALARKVLREDLIEHLPADQRYEALMAANAIAISLRQLEEGESDDAAEAKAVAALLGDSVDDDVSGNDAHAALTRLYQRLGQDIRAGQLDPGCPGREAALQHLRTITKQRVGHSNPKALPTD